MAGLDTLDRQRREACDRSAAAALKLKETRDPARAKELVREATGDLEHAAERVEIISREDGWKELDRK